MPRSPALPRRLISRRRHFDRACISAADGARRFSTICPRRYAVLPMPPPIAPSDERFRARQHVVMSFFRQRRFADFSLSRRERAFTRVFDAPLRAR